MSGLTVADISEFCLSLPGAWPDNPWDHEHPVIKVGAGERGKIFAFLGHDSVGVKAADSREVADEWIHRYPGEVTVMAYLGRSGWNTMKFGGGIPDEEILDAIEESYDRVVRKLPMRVRPVRPD